MAAKKKTTRKKTAKRKTTRKKAAKKVSRKKAPRALAGYYETASGILVPAGIGKPVPPGKIRKGFEKARTEIKGMVEDLAKTLNDRYVISEIELTASFNARGEFLGFGVGGAASIKIRLTPDGSDT